ncbi:transcriptional repressor tup12-like [Gigantopelta aegis]|uniref:transcriptional repressor tup12-like n=1 Tax=Gigantopelta aegis TaxID=1735272 RepID=UPI001B88AE38|nr:transcriptional repressor tup12-like [Gigantopelta aegis]
MTVKASPVMENDRDAPSEFIVDVASIVSCSSKGFSDVTVILHMILYQIFLTDVAVNKPGTLAAVGLDEGPIVLFNLKTYTLMYMIKKIRADSRKDLYIRHALITDDGKYLIFQAGKQYSDAISLVSWDIPKKRQAAVMVDAEDEDNYATTGVESLELLNGTTVLAKLDRVTIRLYDLKTGVLNQMFDEHTGGAMVRVVAGGPYILTYWPWAKDNTLQLLDMDMKRLAIYSLESNLNQVELTKDGYRVVGFMCNESRPVVWELKGGPSNSKPDGYSHLDSFPAIFGDDVLEVGLTILEEDDEHDDPNDLDEEDDEQDDTGDFVAVLV